MAPSQQPVALFDRVAYYDEDGERRTLQQGDPIEGASEEELARLKELGAAGDPGELEEPEATEAAPGNSSDVPDEELADFTVDEVVAHLQQYPGDVDRIDRLEDSRDRGRRDGVDDALAALRGGAREERTPEG